MARTANRTDAELHLRQAEQGSLADILAFDSWPEEHKRIARVAVYNDILDAATEEAHQNGRDEMHDQVTKEYRGAPRAVVKRTIELLRPLLLEARAGHFTMPEKIDAVLKELEEFPEELAVDP